MAMGGPGAASRPFSGRQRDVLMWERFIAERAISSPRPGRTAAPSLSSSSAYCQASQCWPALTQSCRYALRVKGHLNPTSDCPSETRQVGSEFHLLDMRSCTFRDLNLTPAIIATYGPLSALRDQSLEADRASPWMWIATLVGELPDDSANPVSYLASHPWIVGRIGHRRTHSRTGSDSQYSPRAIWLVNLAK